MEQLLDTLISVVVAVGATVGGFVLLTTPPFVIRLLRREGWPATAEAG